MYQVVGIVNAGSRQDREYIMENFQNHINQEIERLNNMTRLLITLPNKVTLKFYCLDDDALERLMAAYTNWTGQQIDMILEDYVPINLMRTILPENGLDESQVIRKLHRFNSGLSTSQWSIIRMAETPNETEFVFEIDRESMMFIEEKEYELQYKDYTIQMHHVN